MREKKEKVIVWGTGKIAEVVYFYLKEDSEYEVCAFCLDEEYIDRKEFYGLPVVGFQNIELIYTPSEYLMSIPIGYTSMNSVRTEKYMEAKAKGYSFVTYISSKAVYYGTPVGENCIIMEHNVIQPFTQIGDNVIMWSGNHLGHHSIIESHCFIASHVVISGASVIGESSFLGVNSTIRDNIKIGKFNLIGAGSVILADTLDYNVFTAKAGTCKLEKKSIDIRYI